MSKNTELDEIILQIQTLNTEIRNIETEKLEANEMVCSEMDILILDCQIQDLETRLEEEKKRYNDLRELLDFQSNCNHEFVDDLIDIDPDRSKTIKYCMHCFFTFEN
jgi:hypothetical protein